MKFYSREVIYSNEMSSAYHTTMVCNGYKPDIGKPFERVVIMRPDAAAVLVTNEHAQVLMIRQFREAVDYVDPIYEIPAGKVDPGEDARAAAVRELGEECNLQASSVKLIKSIWVSPGWTNEKIHIFHADTVIATNDYSPDGDEEIESVWMSVSDAITATNDAKSLVALYWLQASKS
jgi:ADP-ribose pyrophosphatase